MHADRHLLWSRGGHAISVMEMLEVFDARMVCAGVIRSRPVKVLNFNSGISGMASMTRSTAPHAPMSVEVEIRPRAPSASAWFIRSLVTSLAEAAFDGIHASVHIGLFRDRITITSNPATAAAADLGDAVPHLSGTEDGDALRVHG